MPSRPPAFLARDGQGVHARVGVEENLGTSHDGEASEFGITAFMADDGGDGDAVDLEQSDGIARSEDSLVVRSQMVLGVAIGDLALPIECDEAVVELAGGRNMGEPTRRLTAWFDAIWPSVVNAWRISAGLSV